MFDSKELRLIKALFSSPNINIPLSEAGSVVAIRIKVDLALKQIEEKELETEEGQNDGEPPSDTTE